MLEIYPNAPYSKDDLVDLLDMTPQAVKKSMAAQGYKGGIYSGADVIRAGLGLLHPDCEMPVESEPEPAPVLIHGFEVDNMYSIPEIATVLKMANTTVRTRLMKAVILPATPVEQAKAKFTRTTVTRYHAERVIQAVEDGVFADKMPQISKQAAMTSVTQVLFEDVVSNMSVDDAQSMLNAFVAGLEQGTI